MEFLDNIKDKTGQILKGFGTIIIYFLVANVCSYLLRDLANSSNMILAEGARILVYVITLGVIFLLYHKRLINDFKTFKKDNVNVAVRNWLIGLGFMVISNLVISFILQGMAVNESANRELLKGFPISSVITMVLLAPILEEITFRCSFKKAFSKWYTFALFTGLIFGFVHTLVGLNNLSELLYIIPYGGLGFFFAKAFYETDNIYTSIMCHIFHNGMCVGFLLLGGL